MSDIVERANAMSRLACKLSDDAMENENWDDLDLHISALADMCRCFAEAAAEIEQLRTQRDALVAVLRQAEWGGWDEQSQLRYCPVCAGSERTGHTGDCALAAAVADARGGKDGV